MKFFLVKDQFGVLRAADDQAKEVLKGFGQGELLFVEVVKSRNPLHHKKYFALLQVTFENQQEGHEPHYDSVEELRAACLCEIGQCTIYDLGDGVTYRVPKSIAWDKMDQLKFNEIYDLSVDWMSNLIGTDPETLKREAA